MNLAEIQQEFMAHILGEDRRLPPHWNVRMGDGLEIYRNAYRTRLVDAMRETFPRRCSGWARTLTAARRRII